MFDLIVRGGIVVTPAGEVRADLAVEDGRIAAIERDLAGAREEIDAHGLTIFPGVIDVHVHFNAPGNADWEGAETGSRALAAGGGTMFFDMPLNSLPCTIGSAEFQKKREILERTAVTDFGLWGGLVPGNTAALPDLAECGAVGFKAFMCDSGLPEFPRADDYTLYEGMRVAAKLALPVAVHAENAELTAGLSAHSRKSGIREYLDSRPVIAEVEAIERATLLARETGAALHIVHVSSGRGVAAALEGRARGADVSIETCAHYLFFTEEDLLRMGAVLKCAPPLRDTGECERLWEHVQQGGIDMVASDHSPAPPSMKTGDNFFAIWGGIAGVQSTLSVLLQRGLGFERIAALTAGNPARRFGMIEKGSIAVGKDADLVLVNTGATFRLEEKNLFQRHGFSPYTGREFKGVIQRSLLRGQTIFQEGKITAQAGGRFIRPKSYATSRTHT